jgi:4'-phosphopantetheinyl transferase
VSAAADDVLSHSSETLVRDCGLTRRTYEADLDPRIEELHEPSPGERTGRSNHDGAIYLRKRMAAGARLRWLPLRTRSLHMIPADFELTPERIDIWTFPLDASLWEAVELPISAGERARGRRFRFPVHQRRFLAARSGVRLILSRYTGISADRLRFENGPAGKPELVGVALSFNLSHSDELAALAVARDGLIGIDIERTGRHDDLLDIARRFFAPGEVELLVRLSAGALQKAFYRIWTCHEALLKAVGRGLLSSDEIELTLNEDGSACVVRAPPELEGDLNLNEIAPAAEYIGAVAWKPNSPCHARLQLREWRFGNQKPS